MQSATTVRVRDGRVSATDGPFAETKEQLGAFYLIDARDLNGAIQVASRIPSARMGERRGAADPGVATVGPASNALPATRGGAGRDLARGGSTRSR